MMCEGSDRARSRDVLFNLSLGWTVEPAAPEGEGAPSC
jgi:hypothetical protein